MEKMLTVTVANINGGEDGLSAVCREGKLFRNDSTLEDLYKEGFRIYNYDVVDNKADDKLHYMTTVKVMLRK